MSPSLKRIRSLVEPDESPAEAALREMREETGCDVELRGIIGCFGGPKFRVKYKNGDEVAYVMTVYRATITRGVPGPNEEETTDVRFIAPRDVVGLEVAEWLPDVLDAAHGT